MGTYCSLILVGRAGSAPEDRVGPSGKRWCTLRLALSRLEGPDRREVTDWFTIKAFDMVAESAVRFVRKGDLVLVDGRLRNSEFTDAQGVRQLRTEVIAQTLRVMSKNQAAREGEVSAAPPGPSTAGIDLSAVPF